MVDRVSKFLSGKHKFKTSTRSYVEDEETEETAQYSTTKTEL